MVKTEKGWQCTECEYMSTAKYEQNCRQNLKVHVLVKHCEPEDIPCQYCNKVFRNLPTHQKHVYVCTKKAADSTSNLV